MSITKPNAMKTYTFYKNGTNIPEREFISNAPEKWEKLLNEDNEIIFSEFKAVLRSEEVDCEECNGEGKKEERNCNDASSECCGGCFKDVECSECNGSGKITIEY